MPDHIDKYTDQQEAAYARKIAATYKKAAQEVRRQITEFTAKHKAKAAKLLQKVNAGEISMADYQAWLQGQVFIGKQWRDKLDDIVRVYTDADEKARQLMRGTVRDVFTESANYAAYQLEGRLGAAVDFHLYDAKTVDRLMRTDPQMLPEWKINEPKDYRWNAQRVRSTLTRAIIEGKPIPDIAEELGQQLATDNGHKMVLFARTAMTGAQNAGRIERLHDAQSMGIKVKKKWLATLDSRTRDTHADLDGQERDVDEDFEVGGMHIAYPGDPSAPPELVYNCRCTMTYVYPGYEHLQHGERRDQETGYTVAQMSYREWQQAKESGQLTDYSSAKEHLFSVEEQIVIQDAEHVFSGIWKQDVTYADFPQLESRIPAKRQYFEQQLAQAVASGDTAAEQKFRGLLKELETFEQNGAVNSALLAQRDAAAQQVQDIASKFKPQPSKKKSPFDPDAYSDKRRNAATWAQTPREADAVLRAKTGEVWRGATPQEKDAIYEYTRSFHKFNEPLRGIEYGTNRYLGVGNTDLNASYANNGERLNAMTDIIAKCTYDRDIWLRRGCQYGGMDKFFQCDMSLLQTGSESELRAALLGKPVQDFGFMSCGSAGGRGFSGAIEMRIYCPKGTQMMYVEPFSAYGSCASDGKWDGKRTQSSFGSELETILQQGTQMRIRKIDRPTRGGTIVVELDVIDQSSTQRWHK